MLKRIIAWALILFCYSSIAEEFSSLDNQPRIQSIEIAGLSRTKEKVVRRELTFKEGDILTTDALLFSIQELKNLQIFAYVRPFLELQPDNKVNLRIELQEKWTIIPFFSYTAGGKTEHIKAGVYDINVLGKYVEVGVLYDNWNGEHGGIVWYRNPRFMRTRNLFGMDLHNTQVPVRLYNRDGEKTGSFVLKAEKFNLLYEVEISRLLRLGLLAEYSDDMVHSIERFLSEDNYTFQKLSTNRHTKTLLNTFTITLGKLHYDIDIIKGKNSELLLSHSSTDLLSDFNFNKIKWINQAYWQLPWRSYIATNFTLAATDTGLIQQYYYVGGFQHIRGYFDGQYRNRSYWQVNAEYRIPSYRSKWIILQHVFFIDAINSANRINELNHFNNNVYSAGFGIRLISPRIYSFNGRLDIALYTSGISQTSISLGTQHFF